MSNLKFLRVDWEKDLMFVEFETDGQVFRWYPKWKDVDLVLHCAWLTEQGYRDSRWKNYIEIMASEVVIRTLVYRIAPGGPTAPRKDLDILASRLFRELRKVSLQEEQDAST